MGSRGTGKSTWIHHSFPQARTFNLLDESLYQSLLRDISLFSGELNTLSQNTWVVVDEVQRLPELLNEAHRFIETKNLRFVLCGSSARKLKKQGTNLLAGRALKRTMYPFVPEELGKDFDIETALAFGTLPVIWQSLSKKESLSAYVELYLKEEIQAEALVRNLPGFARFLPIAALFHAQTLNTSGLSRDAGVSRTTVSGYIQILEDTLMAFRLPAFEGGLRVREKRHPKFYWIDAGLVRAVKKQFSPLSHEERGSIFEGWVANLLRIYGDYHDLFDDWYYWSPAEAKQTEVDFLLKRRNEFIAVEAKSTPTVSSIQLAGLRAIEELKNVKRRILVYAGKRTLRTPDGIDILPLSEFTQTLERAAL
ncbi:MAG: ATP-binding protein [Candidatus Omnitrophica bacterium]|nr:ATP-binding protein [Candidatus Omnitrophota bacterium]